MVDAFGNPVFHTRTFAEANERLGRVHRVVLTFTINTAEHGVHAGGEEHNIGVCFRMGNARRAAGRQPLLIGGYQVFAEKFTANIGGSAHHRERQHFCGRERFTRHFIDCAPVFRGELPPGGTERILVLGTQTAHQITRVNQHRAARNAHAVYRAGIHTVVFVFLAQTLGKLSITISLCRSDFAAQHNALARGQRQILRGAHRLAVPAFHTPIDFFLNGFGNLQIGGIIGVFLGENHTRVQKALRVDQALNFAHDLEELVTELATYKRGHNTPGSVLCLE